MVPDADETVYGTSVSYGGLGNPEYVEPSSGGEPVAANRPLPEEEPVGPSPLDLADEGPSQEYNAPQPMPTRREDVAPESTEFNMGALDSLMGLLGQNKAMEPIGGFGIYSPSGNSVKAATPVTQTLADLGMTQEEADAIAAQFKANQMAAAPLTQLSKEEIAKQAGVSVEDLEKSEAQIGAVYGPRQRALDEISTLLKSNDFAGAFDAATRAEQELGQDFIGNILSPDKFRYLRGPMTAEEIKKFYNEMPEEVFKERYVGPGNEFKKEQAIERNIAALEGGAGYADPTLGIKKEETLLGKLPIKELAALAAVAMGATAIPGLFGAGSTSGAGAGAAGAGGAGAGGAGAAGGATAAGATAAGGAAAAAPLAEVVITASKLGLTIPQATALLATTGAGASALGGGAAPSAPTTPAPEAPLDEIVVTGKRALDPALRGLIPTSLASTNLVQGVSDIPTDIYGQPEAVEPAEQPQQEPAQDDLAQVLVQTGRVQPGVLDLAAIGTGGLTAADLLRGYTQPAVRPYEELPPETEAPVEEEVVVTGSRAAPIDLAGIGVGGLTAAQLLQGYTQPSFKPYEQLPPESEPMDEVVVKGSKPTPIDLAGVGVGGLTAAQLLQGYTQPNLRPYEQLPPEGEPMDEVVVKGSKITPIDLAGIGVGGLTAAQLLQGFTQPKVDPFTGETKQPSKTEQELDKIQDALKAGTPIPGTSSFLKELLDKYGTLENALKAIGALGSALSKPPKAGTATGGATGAGGMGGALPKYTIARQQLSPDIDYYTYGTRPEAKFFESTTQLERPVQPELPPARPPQPDMVMAEGGLTGYAKGGSKSSRYVDGPGSGREDKIPALLSDGEYVIDAETLALLGDGSTKEGARRMDKFRANIRKHKGRALSRGRISPNAKSPDKYMGGGLT
jgi:hypothetical protein